MSTPSHAPSLASSRSASPSPPVVQPDHFYGSEGVHFPPSPNSNGRTWLEPDDDPLASRGIPVFKPSMEEFQDFEGYMNRVECWGMRSGIVKVIPPKEWTESLPPLANQLAGVKLKNPIEQHMIGHGGLFRQQNVEKRRVFSVREWAELCNKEDRRAPSVNDVGLHHTRRALPPRTRTKRGERKPDVTKAASSGPAPAPVIAGPDNATSSANGVTSPGTLPETGSKSPNPTADSAGAQAEQSAEEEEGSDEEVHDDKPQKTKPKRKWLSREVREAHLAQRAAADAAFLESFDPRTDWLPPDTTAADYTPEFCKDLERQYWRNCGFGTPAMYGADMEGSLFTDDTKAWNVAHLPSLLDRLLPSTANGLPGVNTPYLYFGMWRATFAWHVEDMDLFSINYIHFGAGKFWYAVPQTRASALEQAMRGHFPEPSRCPQFLRHKSYLASPMTLAKTSCRPNTLVQHAGEFVITYPRGYHAGFNLGFNCAESVNFALDSWIELGRKAQICNCVSDSVRIDVDELLLMKELEAEAEAEAVAKVSKPKSKPKSSHSSSTSAKKRKSDENDGPSKSKKAKVSSNTSDTPLPRVTIKLKLGPRPPELEPFPCCLCVSTSREGLLPVHDKPVVHHLAYAEVKVWMAHESCARVLPETWIDEIEVDSVLSDGTKKREKMVFGVDAIVKDRWNLKCTACSKNRPKVHGAPVQCTRGKCSKAFHVSCARDGAEHGIVYKELAEVEKDVVLVDVVPAPDLVTLMEVDGTTAPLQDAVSGPVTETPAVKVIKKVEFQLLCPQHNPLMLEAKKANKQDRIRKDLLALEPMSRIKIRVSAGIFEVSLVRVIEESGAVEVLWDRGLKREFKWGSVVFGNLEGHTIGQKPTEAAPDPELFQQPIAPQPQASTSNATANANAAAPTAYIPYQQPHLGSYPYAVGPWPYPYQIPTMAGAYAMSPPVAQGDAGVTASGAFAYPFSGVQFTAAQTTYVPPPIRYPYGAPAHPASTSAATSSGNSKSGTPVPAERPYAGFQWKEPYTGPRDPAPAAQSRAQSETRATSTTPEASKLASSVATPQETSNDNTTQAATASSHPPSSTTPNKTAS
ncbi:JmjC domain, hydroxylase-domain-containing protein [Gloeopeniophorella convolvens]|nr:JmjC domain, hydroxylase-domain-containing protein [Gloeopeniophorella convolvens]